MISGKSYTPRFERWDVRVEELEEKVRGLEARIKILEEKYENVRGE